MRKRIKLFFYRLAKQYEEELERLEIVEIFALIEYSNIFIIRQLDTEKRFLIFKLSLVESILNWI
jgi:hypothetical protein